MKTKNVRLLMLCLFFPGFSFGISAQTHLDALIKKCETLESVDMEVVKNKRRTDKDVELKTVNIRIKKDKKLVSEFLNAFKKDADNAEQTMFRKRKGSNEINYYQCRFLNQTYTIVVKEAGDANVTVGNGGLLHFEPLYRQKEREEQHKELTKQHQERMKQYKEQMKQYKLKNLDSIFSKQNIIADSLILKSSTYFNSINWDSITSKFGKDVDSLALKLGVGWNEILERYDFE
ncbi:MAG: DUF5024 domain-containing protein [Dysgonamonadaceae bacterium]|jgi:hypothetical protein|nr:DUF5024 domain-containing protein [Dysgonamonadaceae bacterium]